MATLTNTKIKDTYDGLLKTTDNDVIGASEKNITDGLGNASVLSIGTASASFSSDIEVNGLTIGLGSGSIVTNTALGLDALFSNTSGSGNVSVGQGSMRSNTSGLGNVAVGKDSLRLNTTGVNNTALGYYALYNITGSDNIAIGESAGQYSTAALDKTAGDQNIYIGANTVSGGQDTDNEIVIGYGVTGNGSNTATYGNSSITDHYFDGNVRADYFYGDGSNLTNLPSSTTPTLQQVTTAGSTTDRTIVIERQVSPTLDFEDSSSTGNTSSYIRFKRTNSSTNYGRISYDSLGDEMVFSTQTASNTVLTLNSSGHGEFTNNLNVGGNLAVDTNTLYVDAANNRVGIGTSSPGAKLEVNGDGSIFRLDGTANTSRGMLLRNVGTATAEIKTDGNLDFNIEDAGRTMRFLNGNTERMRIDSAGNVGIGIQSLSMKFQVKSSGTSTEDVASFGNANISDGLVVTTNGNLDWGLNARNTRNLTFSTNQTERMRIQSNGQINLGDVAQAVPSALSATVRFIPAADQTVDLGFSTRRWEEVWSINGTINTSDANEKQQIEDLDEAELRVATRIKGLVKKFKWNTAVEKKGENARIHIGVIAQDVKEAFEAEGLDADRYSLFTSNTWWEKEIVEVDEQGVETTKIEIYEEFEEGATERTRLGVRYTELLAFVISAL